MTQLDRGTDAGSAQGPRPRRRIAVVGGGIAGLATAWLLDDAHDVVLVERADWVGGHARSVTLDTAGSTVRADLAAQFVTPSAQPTYWRLAHDVLGVDFIPIRGTAALAGPRGRLLVTTRPYRTPVAVAALAALITAGRSEYQGTDSQGAGDWETTVEEFVETRLRWIPRKVREDVLYPWIAVYGNCVVSLAKQTSARAALAFMVRPAVSSRLATVPYYNAAEGLGATADRLRDRIRRAEVRLSTEIVSLARESRGLRLTGADGWSEFFDEVVLAVPAAVARRLLADTGVAVQAYGVLADFRDLRAELAIHVDPVYMPAQRRDWTAFNAISHGDHCEASVWYGGLRSDCQGLPIFKSWVTFRSRRPAEVVAAAEYHHPVILPGTIGAQHRLASFQGIDGVWFAGSYTDDVDSQESATVSAVRVAERLAPYSAKFTKLAAPQPMTRQTGNADGACEGSG